MIGIQRPALKSSDLIPLIQMDRLILVTCQLDRMPRYMGTILAGEEQAEVAAAAAAAGVVVDVVVGAAGALGPVEVVVEVVMVEEGTTARQKGSSSPACVKILGSR